MKRSLVIGRTNVGKTLFCIHFARYLGIRELRWLIERTDGRTEEKRMSMQEASSTLSDAHSHRTRSLQSVSVEIPRGKSTRQILLTDTTGFSDGIHPDTAVREAMAQTLNAMIDAGFILHVVDAAQVGKMGQERSLGISQVERQLIDYGMQREGYLLLANKMDLPEAKQGFRLLLKRYSKHRVLPVSAMYGTGFREVKQHVWRYA